MNSLLDRATAELNGHADTLREYTTGEVDRICRLLEGIGQELELLGTSNQRFTIPASADADAAGAATIKLPTRQGYPWMIERLTTVVAAGAASIGVLYVGAVAPPNARHVIPDADFYAQDVGLPIFVPPQSDVFIVLSGCPANAKCTAVIQVIQENFK